MFLSVSNEAPSAFTKAGFEALAYTEIGEAVSFAIADAVSFATEITRSGDILIATGNGWQWLRVGGKSEFTQFTKLKSRRAIRVMVKQHENLASDSQSIYLP